MSNTKSKARHEENWTIETEKWNDAMQYRILENGEVICSFTRKDNIGRDGNKDSKLIAAAPKLLRVLKELLDASFSSDDDWLDDVREKARQAIKKATN